MKCPDTINNQFALLEELVKKIPDAVPEMKTALRDALLEMSAGFKINAEGKDFKLFLVRLKQRYRLHVAPIYKLLDKFIVNEVNSIIV